MRLRVAIGFALIICIIFIISLLDLHQIESTKTTESLNETFVKEEQAEHLEQLVSLENKTAKDTSDSSLTSTDKTPDYTKMFPDLYSEYIKPKEADKERKVVYLTFDDGPSDNTYDILDILEDKNVKATFFIVGNAISDKREDSLRRMVNEGHTIGIHSYSHLCNEIYCSVERYLDDFNTVYEQIYNITGKRVNIYRFPWGSNNAFSKNIKNALLEEMERRGFACYDWNVDTKDAVGQPTAYSILKNIRKDIKRYPNPIVLMHDIKTSKTTVQLLPYIIDMLSDMGYEFDTLDNREQYLFPWG